MKDLDQNKKLELLCAVLRKEAVAPAQEESARLLDQAKEEANRILEAARIEAGDILCTAQKEAKIFREEVLSQLKIASQQLLEHLRQKIEKTFFSTSLKELLEKRLNAGKGVNGLIEIVAKSIETLGLERAVILELPKGLVLNDVVKECVDNIMKNSPERSVNFNGVSIRCHFSKEGWSLDLSAESLIEMFLPMVQKSIRDHVFSSEK